MRSNLLCVLLCVLCVVACLLMCPSAAMGQDVAAEEANGVPTLTQGVDSIATAGIPGPIAVYGERAFCVIAGSQDDGALLPVVAGAEWGRGRVVAFGHGGLIGKDALADAGTGRLVLNAVRWLGGGDAPRVLVVGNGALVDQFKAAGMTVLTAPTPDPVILPKVDVLAVDAHSLRAVHVADVRAFVDRGGGLLTAGLGWGWLQLNPGKTIHDHPGNLVLREMGLAWCDGMLDTTGEGRFVVRELPATIHARAAFASLEADGREPDAQAGAAVTAAVRVMPESDPLFQRAAALLDQQAAELVVSEQSPLKSKDAVLRALLALQVELEKRARPAEVRAHPSSAAFPGAVELSATRVTQELTVDLSIPGWHSTGLYAPPGGVVSVRADGSATGSTLRIGCHTDQLWHHRAWKRVPDVAREWPLRENALEAASAFGGLVYIEVPQRRSGSATFTIEGVVESPRFVLGKTTREEWLAARGAPGPWGELESGKVIVSVPSSHLRTLDDPTAVLEFWDRISDAHATLAAIPLQPDRPHRFVADVQISAGYMHSGYPIMTHMDAAQDMVSADNLRKGCWGLLHELGHNHQEDEWTFDGTVEVTCNLFSLHAIDTVCTPDAGNRGHPGVNTPPSLEKYLALGAPFEQWKRDPFLALHMYVQLQRAFGWGTFQRVFAEYRTLPREQRPADDDAERDQWMVRFSRACGKNLGPFFQAWGVPTSASARESIADLPGWMPDEMK
ncbi:MAG TPA: M60 family metallopeptidase [Phycisphaerales bacterium]|nr:M60 family metallopeptidase [Phycisphaerales bacterium]